VDHSKEALWCDANGNTVNPMEIGKRIEGRVEISSIVPVDMVTVDTQADALQENLKNKDINPDLQYVSDTVLQKLFTQDRPIEILPTPFNVNAELAQVKYPATAGVIIRPDIYGEFGALREQGYTVADTGIWIHAQVFVHTSLGELTASREGIKIRCTDPLSMGESGTGSCLTNENAFYLAWDLKDSTGQWVPTGNYVMSYEFYWTITATNKEGETETVTRDMRENVQQVSVSINGEPVPVLPTATPTSVQGTIRAYDLRGNFIGSSLVGARPGVYLLRQGSQTRKIVVR
jgi:hypothetical protein